MRLSVGGLILAALAGGCAGPLLLHPTTHPLLSQSAERIVVPWDGGQLEVWRARSPGARAREVEAFDLQFVGNGSRAEAVVDRIAARFGDWPVEVWCVNYPGYGGSSGDADLSSISPAALAAYDTLLAVSAERPILAGGSSFGAAVALHVAVERPVAGLILQNPPPFRDLIYGEHGWWNLFLIASIVAWQVPSELDAISNAARVTAPALFLSSSADRVVPPEYQQRVIDAYAGEKEVLRLSGGHNQGLLPAEAAEVAEAISQLRESVRVGLLLHK